MSNHEFARTGTVIATDLVESSRDLVKYALSKLDSLGLETDFDCIHNDLKTFAVTEFCGALGGINVRLMDFHAHRKTLIASIKAPPTRFHDYASDIQNAENADKYKLRSTGLDCKGVIFLSGSNLMHKNIDFNRVEMAIEEGAIIKPHPITNAQDHLWLRHTFGSDKVVGSKVSGAQLARSAKTIYAAKNSELWFVGLAHNKLVRDIGQQEFMNHNYLPYVDAIYKSHLFFPRVSLNRLFSSPTSGLYFTKEQIDSDLEKYIEMVKGNQK